MKNTTLKSMFTVIVRTAFLVGVMLSSTISYARDGFVPQFISEQEISQYKYPELVRRAVVEQYVPRLNYLAHYEYEYNCSIGNFDMPWEKAFAKVYFDHDMFAKVDTSNFVVDALALIEAERNGNVEEVKLTYTGKYSFQDGKSLEEREFAKTMFYHWIGGDKAIKQLVEANPELKSVIVEYVTKNICNGGLDRKSPSKGMGAIFAARYHDGKLFLKTPEHHDVLNYIGE